MNNKFKDKMPVVYNNFPILLLLIINILWFKVLEIGKVEDIPSYDAVFFLKMAQNILHFGEFGWLGYHEPCFYSIVTAVVSYFTNDFFSAGVLVSKISILSMIFVTYILAKELYGKNVGIMSAISVSFLPHIYAISGTPQSEPLYAFLLTLSVYLLWLTCKRQSISIGIVTGILFTTAYLTRSEGILILFLLLTTSIMLAIKNRSLTKRLVASLMVVISVFFIFSLPYLLYLKNHYGVWTLGTKTSSIYFWVREKQFHDPDPERLEWGLSPKGELNLISLTSKDLINYWLKDPEKSINAYFKSLKGQIPGFIDNDGAMRHFPQVYPLYFAVPLVIGLIIRRIRRESIDEDCYLLSAFLIFFVYALLTAGWWRYHLNYLPLFVILAVSGLNEINNQIMRYFTVNSFLKKTGDGKLLLWLFIVTVSLYHYWVVTWQTPPGEVKSYTYRKTSMALETKKAGEWAQKRFSPGSNYMAEWTRLPYYLNGRWTAKPETTLDGMIWYARKNRVDYIVYETSGKGESEEIIRVMGNTPDLEVADVYESQSQRYGVVFLRLKSNK